MKWTEPKPPTEGICFYDHVDCETPLGLIRIEWKSWKESPSHDIMINKEWIGVEYDLEKAKLIASNWLNGKWVHLTTFLNKIT